MEGEERHVKDLQEKEAKSPCDQKVEGGGTGELRGRVQGREGEMERERGLAVFCCATEPHSRHGGDSR